MNKISETSTDKLPMEISLVLLRTHTHTRARRILETPVYTCERLKILYDVCQLLTTLSLLPFRQMSFGNLKSSWQFEELYDSVIVLDNRFPIYITLSVSFKT